MLKSFFRLLKTNKTRTSFSRESQFLVDVFKEKGRLIQWLVFSSLIQRDRLFCQFNAIFCSFVQLRGRLIFWGLRSRRAWVRVSHYTRNFFASKSRGETKGSLFGFFQHFATFFGNFKNSINIFQFDFFKFFQSLWSGKKHLMSLKGLVLGFSANCDIFKQRLFLKKKPKANEFFVMFPVQKKNVFESRGKPFRAMCDKRKFSPQLFLEYVLASDMAAT